MTDWELLETYRSARCEKAFGELVRRHLPLVLGICRRRAPASAEDAAQAVFLLLAQKPPRHRDQASLAGWLVRTACYACGNANRAQRRRTAHETAAAEETPMTTRPSGRVTDAQVLLDDALSDLPTPDRDIVLLRYYEGLDVSELAARLGVPATTAAKRLSRAVGRIREFFARNGAACSATLVTEQIAALAQTQVPPGIIESITTAAVGKSAATSVASEIFRRTVQTMRRTQLKWAAGVAAVVLAIGGGGVAAFLDWSASSRVTQGSAAFAAEQPVDNRPPKEILKAFAAAIRASDGEAMRRLVHAPGDWDKRMLDAACRAADSARSLKQAVAAKFGADAAAALAKQNFGPLDGFATAVEQTVDHVEVKVEGDVASICPPGMAPDEAFVLEKVDGAWRISAAKMTEIWPENVRNERLMMVQSIANALDQLAQEVRDEKYANVQEFTTAVQTMFGQR